jgi:hypothetical protein
MRADSDSGHRLEMTGARQSRYSIETYPINIARNVKWVEPRQIARIGKAECRVYRVTHVVFVHWHEIDASIRIIREFSYTSASAFLSLRTAPWPLSLL